MTSRDQGEAAQGRQPGGQGRAGLRGERPLRVDDSRGPHTQGAHQEVSQRNIKGRGSFSS